ncbi:MAG: thiamine pyrophosphate-binding protein, partial [Exilibacterium sp.]
MNLSDEHLHRFSTVLVEHGVDKAFGITGSGLSLRLICALREKGVDYHCVGHEAAAALMAGGALKRDGIGAVSISIKGPGFVNLVPGLLSNFYEGRPMASVSEAYNGDAPCHMAHKRLDHKSLCSNVAKGYGKVSTRGEDISRLLALAGSEYPGPVHVDLCKQAENSLSVFSRE